MSAQNSLILVLAAATWLAALQSACTVQAAQGSANAVEKRTEGWSDGAAQGRALYYGTRSFVRPAAVSGAPLPASASACVQCHGPLGEGSREANVAAPDIRGSAPRTHGTSLLHALRDGRGADGHTLSPIMPRYTPTAEELTALEAFWPWLGNASQPQRGISASELRLGLVLDGLTHPTAREQVAAGVQSALDATNAVGGVHGRRLRLIQAERTLPDDVFALVASTLTPEQHQRLREQRLPSIATLDFLAHQADPSGWQWPLLPSMEQQARIALEQLKNAPSDCTHFIFDPRHLSGSGDVLQAKPPNVAEPRPPGMPLCVAAFASAAEVDILRMRWRNEGIKLQQLIELSGMRGAPLEEPELDHRLVLFVPLNVARFAEQHGLSLWFVLGQIAARTTVEALARSGRNVVPESLLAQTRMLTGYEPLPGAPLAFSRSSAHGWLPESFASSSPLFDQHPRKELP
ncbi:hypothetical protein G7047_29045 [Diaphorobacter sp. HDW4A]|uniref:cytochrome c/ABC transporter substrate-binding protein n=1 Tax=Diaphorobacter sp. HDW4A TaxID=2714924 RepID=UPI00140E6CAF|nr:hypothetical protein [Diaphorobacter sp. HDW4A]QIL83538.1 hypothetical protein G7047_29045 [Diaphorobacter sp. HDW4A]